MNNTYAKQLNILVGITGCIAAYKSCEIVRGLQKAGCNVKVVMTQNACQFIGKRTFEALTGSEVCCDLFNSKTYIPHIELSKWADLFLIAPCTANVMAKISCGVADDVLTSCALAMDAPTVLAPAMNTHMWNNPATQNNIDTLKKRSIRFIEPVSGRLACGEEGSGKLAEVNQIVEETLLVAQEQSNTSNLLQGKTVMITAGPTQEFIDPVRYLTNPSTGKMGYALAEAAVKHGAQKTILVSGPCNIVTPSDVELIDVISAQDMYDACMERLDEADIVICSAAVADWRPKQRSDIKLKKDKSAMQNIEFVRNQDILAEISMKATDDMVVVGFAAETNDVVENAEIKLNKKGCDLIVANDVSCKESTFGSDTNKVVFVGCEQNIVLDTMPKKLLANKIIEHAATILESRSV